MVHAEILAYEMAAAHDWFEDGSEKVYDMTVMKVLSPAEYVNRGDLRIMHDALPARDSQWRRSSEEGGTPRATTVAFSIQDGFRNRS